MKLPDSVLHARCRFQLWWSASWISFLIHKRLNKLPEKLCLVFFLMKQYISNMWAGCSGDHCLFPVFRSLIPHLISSVRLYSLCKTVFIFNHVISVSFYSSSPHSLCDYSLSILESQTSNSLMLSSSALSKPTSAAVFCKDHCFPTSVLSLPLHFYDSYTHSSIRDRDKSPPVRHHIHMNSSCRASSLYAHHI